MTPPKSGAERQAELRARLKASGRVRVCVYLDPAVIARLDQIRGSQSRDDFIALLIDAEAMRSGLTVPRKGG